MSAGGASPGPGVRLLYIDDDAGLVRLVARALKARGWSVEHAVDGASGLARIAAGGVDAVALDHHLPAETGLDILARIRALPSPPPVIYVTGSEDLRIAVAALKAGAGDYVLKDLAGHFRELLGEAVQAALEQERLRREKLEAEERQRLLMQELGHRVKNTLALVQAIAAQTLRGEASLAEAREAFEARLIALAQAHDLLLQGSWTEADLASLVAGAVRILAPGEAGRFRISGPDLTLGPRSALSFALALHELGTNATKYGALSTDAGEVAITWSIERAGEVPTLDFRWREAGGPAVAPPRRKGFGSRLIERSLAQGLGADVTLAYPPEGATLSVRVPLEAVQRL
ncbi:sensor histidine kinase [Methylobacterium sp. A54F]